MGNHVTKHFIRFAIAAACFAVCSANHVSAQVLNPSFELNPAFVDWNVTGAASIQTASYDTGSPPTNGSQYALLTNDFTTGSVSTSALESALGYTSGALSALGDGAVIDGSAISQTFNATTGQVLTFDWDFLTNQLDPTLNTSSDDFSFWSVTGSPTILADVDTGTFLSPEGSSQSLDYLDETGFTHLSPISFTIPSTGAFTLDFGVVNVGINSVQSGLLVDNIQLTGGKRSPPPPSGTPEPGSLALVIGLGATCVTGLVRKRRIYA